MSDIKKKENTEELKDEELGEVVGGLISPSQLAHPAVGVQTPKVPTPGVVPMPGVGPAVMPKVVKK